MTLETVATASRSGGDANKRRYARKPRKRAAPQHLLTRDRMDGRTYAARSFDKLVHDIEADLGGPEAVSHVQRSLVRAYVGAAVCLEDLNVRLAQGEDIDLTRHSQLASTMVRLATRIGLERRQRDITPTLADIQREYHERALAAAGEATHDQA